MKQVKTYEPWFFLFFGLFHLHRIWALLDREGYSDFWMGLMERRGPLYFLLMGLLAALCLLGIVTFFQNRGQNYWWRLLYLLGGGYVLFDLFAIAVKWEPWNRLLHWMFDTEAPYWDLLWSGFIVLGAAVFVLSLWLFNRQSRQRIDAK